MEKIKAEIGSFLLKFWTLFFIRGFASIVLISVGIVVTIGTITFYLSPILFPEEEAEAQRQMMAAISLENCKVYFIINETDKLYKVKCD